jgi:hypothetical protein
MSRTGVMLDHPARTAALDETQAALARVRIVLAGCRAQGWRFHDAWSLAVLTVDDPTLAETLRATRASWLRAFRGAPATRSERAASLLVATGEDAGERVDAVVVG